MEYMTIRQAAEKWGVSVRWAETIVKNGRIDGAVRPSRDWLIPACAEKPIDPRWDRKRTKDALADDLLGVIAATDTSLPAHNPDAILNTVSDRLRCILEAELAYLRGDFAGIMACYEQTHGDDAVRLRICPAAIAAAMSLGDYNAYMEIDAYLKQCAKADTNGKTKALAELSLATAAVSMIAPNMAPQWLETGNLSAIAPMLKRDAVYLRVKYFQCTRQFEAMLAAAETALSLCASELETTGHHDIYMRLMCAVACRYLGQEIKAKEWLLESMRMALPYGFITPFAENVTALGGLMEQCLEQEFPDHYDAIIKQWKRTWKNWISFHNRFTKDNITLMLTLREYHLAVLVAHRVPYAKIARQHHISVGRLKNIMLEIYEKLFISGREELERYIL